MAKKLPHIKFEILEGKEPKTLVLYKTSFIKADFGHRERTQYGDFHIVYSVVEVKRTLHVVVGKVEKRGGGFAPVTEDIETTLFIPHKFRGYAVKIFAELIRNAEEAFNPDNTLLAVKYDVSKNRAASPKRA